MPRGKGNTTPSAEGKSRTSAIHVAVGHSQSDLKVRLLLTTLRLAQDLQNQWQLHEIYQSLHQQKILHCH